MEPRTVRRPPASEGPAHDHHVHGGVEPALLASERGKWAVKWSLAVLLLTALLQSVVVAFTGSVALLADTIHNFADAATALPLWIAFALAHRRPTKRFTYGYGRLEDLAGLIVVVLIAASALAAAYESLTRLADPQPVAHLWAVILASLIGFAGNEAVALFRIKIGREIGSAALVVDGYHARADGLTSLAVLLGAAGVWLGYAVADAIIGLLITLAIVRILWQAASAVFTRMLDGVAPEVVDQITRAAAATAGVHGAAEVRVRWLGHRLHAEVNVAVAPALSVEQGHDIATEVRHRLLHDIPYLASATIHVDPATASGEGHHRVRTHAHDDLPDHGH
ncbi:MAG: cation transporter [Chloroflexi bacterium]|nr:cation transporter [Chloroflexota bacterium]